MNSPRLHQKVISDSGRAAELAASQKKPQEIVEELYLLVYSRFPSDDEMKVAVQILQQEGTPRRQAIEDIMWALLNTPEFVFKD